MSPVVTLRSREPSPATTAIARLRSNRPPAGATPAAGLAAPPTGFYSWACCVFDAYEFVYVYGLRADCEQLRRVHRGTTLNKGALPSLTLGQQWAEAAAAHLQEIYQDIGSARAMPVRDFLREKYGLDLDRPAWART